MTLFICGFIVGAVTVPAIISYHNWRVRRWEESQ